MAFNPLNEFIDQITAADTVQSVHDICSRLCKQFGFDHFHYGARFPTSFTQPYFIDVSSYPSEWWQRYKDEGYLAGFTKDGQEVVLEYRNNLIYDDQGLPKARTRDRPENQLPACRFHPS